MSPWRAGHGGREPYLRWQSARPDPCALCSAIPTADCREDSLRSNSRASALQSWRGRQIAREAAGASSVLLVKLSPHYTWLLERGGSRNALVYGEMRSRILNLLEITGDIGIFGFRVVRNIFHAPFEIEETGRQIVEIGTRSVPLIAACGLAIGVVMSLHTRAS